MRSYDVKKLSYRDELARKNRLFFILKLVSFVAAFFAVIGGGVYFLFFTDKLEITNITINGLKVMGQEDILAEVNNRFNQKKFGYLQANKNIFFFDAGKFEADMLLANPVLKNINIRKNLPHELVINVAEREPAGIWCSGSECRYFDDEMQTWGPTVRSSGFLFLTIEDGRPADGFRIDKDFFDAIHEVTANLSQPTVKSIVIPEHSFGEFWVYTDKSFYLIFSLETDIGSQLDVLKIFLEDKSKNPDFAPKYIDLRIEGRVYFR